MHWVVIAAMFLALAGCAGVQQKPEADPVALLAAARAQIAEGDLDDAATTLRDVLSSGPPAAIRVEASLLAGETAMARKEYAEARNSLAEFLALGPGGPERARAEFLIAKSWYLERNRRDRDVTPLREARAALSGFIAAHPGDPHAAEAGTLLAAAVEALVSYERGVAEVYARRGAFPGAAARLEAILRDYPGAPGEDRVLYELIGALERMGEGTRAQSYREQLTTRHPSSPWAEKAAREAPADAR